MLRRTTTSSERIINAYLCFLATQRIVNGIEMGRLRIPRQKKSKEKWEEAFKQE